MNAPASRTCTKCGVEKPLGAFYANPRGSDGRRRDCKACVLAARRARYAVEGQSMLARARARRAGAAKGAS